MELIIPPNAVETYTYAKKLIEGETVIRPSLNATEIEEFFLNLRDHRFIQDCERKTSNNSI